MAVSHNPLSRLGAIALATASVVLVAGVAVATVAGGSTVGRSARATPSSDAYTVTLNYQDFLGNPPIVVQATGFSIGVSHAGATSSQGSAAAANPFTIMRRTDRFSRSLFAAYQAGQTFTSATLTPSRLFAGQARFTFTMTGVSISSMTWSATSNGPPTEEIVLNFTSMTFET